MLGHALTTGMKFQRRGIVLLLQGKLVTLESTEVTMYVCHFLPFPPCLLTCGT